MMGCASAMNNRIIHTAVIDDGICSKLYNTGTLEYDIEITPELEVIERIEYDLYSSGHGTTCAAILKKYAPDVALSSIKILNDNASGRIEQLEKALEWCMANGIKLVNISLGTIIYKDFDKVMDMIEYACKNGLIMVAACSNKGIFTLPAASLNVVGVRCDRTETLKEGEYIYNCNADDGIEITACGCHKIKNCFGLMEITQLSNSYAAPFVTAVIHNIMKENPGITLDGIKEKLRDGSKKYQLPHVNTKKSDMPVIAVYDYGGGKACEIVEQLRRLFIEDGYNAAAALDNCRGMAVGADVDSLSEAVGGFELGEIKKLCGIYDPDILIFGVNALVRGSSYLHEFEKNLEVDIKILVSDDFEACSGELPLNGTNCNIIVVGASDGILDFNSGKAKVFNRFENKYFSKLYEYIIELFDSDDNIE